MLADKEERARRLAKAIKDAGFTSRKEAAARHHFTESTLTSHANGTREFDIKTGYEYARKFRADPVWLLGLRDEPDAPRMPTEDEIGRMIARAMMELPPGVSYADFPQAVSSSVHDQLRRYQAAGGFLDSEDEETVPDIAAQPERSTKRSSPARSNSR